MITDNNKTHLVSFTDEELKQMEIAFASQIVELAKVAPDSERLKSFSQMLHKCAKITKKQKQKVN